jgi:hypothetical protein
VGFFESEPRPEPVADRDFETYIIDVGAPPPMMPGQVAARAVLFHTADAVLVFDHFDVYRHGIRFRIELQLREGNDQVEDWPWQPFEAMRRARGSLPDDLLRLGVVYSDGSSWSNIDSRPMGTEPAPGPTLEFLDGGGSETEWNANVWLASIPPEGLVTFVAEWPLYGIAETRATIDAAELRQAAGRVEDLWSR